MDRRVKDAIERVWVQSEADYRRQIVDLLPVGLPAPTLLDVGCDDGRLTAQLAARLGAQPVDVAGIEVVPERRAAAADRGFDVRHGDIEERWPFDDGTFDVVHANQVIEHVKRLDHFVEETHRMLRPGGVAVICTENLASWHNVAAAALGYMPFSLTNISEKGAVGNRFALHRHPDGSHLQSWQHLHVLTLDGLQSIFELHDFTVERRFASGYYPAFGRVGRALSRRDPRHAHFIGIVVRSNSSP